MESPDSRHTVLFLCTGNSFRSQLAEALVNHDLEGKWVAASAGTRPAGFVHPLALKVLAEVGIEHQGESKPGENFAGSTSTSWLPYVGCRE
jgi:arsenate reductase (thioredoxin)